MTNIFRFMTSRQLKRWEGLRLKGRNRYVLIRTFLYGGIVPSLILWALTMWTSLTRLIFLLLLLSLPIDYAIARLSWIFQEYRYHNTKASLPAA